MTAARWLGAKLGAKGFTEEKLGETLVARGRGCKISHAARTPQGGAALPSTACERADRSALAARRSTGGMTDGPEAGFVGGLGYRRQAPGVRPVCRRNHREK